MPLSFKSAHFSIVYSQASASESIQVAAQSRPLRHVCWPWYAYAYSFG